VRVLVLYAHPDPDSYAAALSQAVVAGLRTGGHEIHVIDLYGEDFDPVMSAADRKAYDTDQGFIDPTVASHAEHVRWAEAMVFVFPTWWAGMPAILKGWFERVLVPGVAFRLDDTTRKVTPALQHVRRLVGVSTYGSPRAYVAVMNDAGRRTVTRALRMVCGRHCHANWLALYSMDRRTDVERRAFLDRVERHLAELR
jgi:putative NADPH-quinone reductase